ncbi:MAG TPA: hypothetical protein VG365_15180 [Solirubrobacteraceae bacterium]|nr:hypothetical protein [Solirubrobacteraceae bacterium]
MRVIETFCQAKRSHQSLCEDAVYVGGDFVAVTDGVSDKSGLDYGAMRAGRWAALTIVDELARCPPWPLSPRGRAGEVNGGAGWVQGGRDPLRESTLIHPGCPAGRRMEDGLDEFVGCGSNGAVDDRPAGLQLTRRNGSSAGITRPVRRVQPRRRL